MTTHTDTPSTLQFARALALASAHGHLWAEQVAPAVWSALADLEAAWDAEDADAEDAARGRVAAEMANPGPSPTRQARGWVEAAAYARYTNAERAIAGLWPATTHVTGTGRLEWDVAEDGAVTLHVRRPGREVLRARVAPSGATRIEVLPGALARHAAVLGCALDALGVTMPPLELDPLDLALDEGMGERELENLQRLPTRAARAARLAMWQADHAQERA